MPAATPSAMTRNRISTLSARDRAAPSARYTVTA
jgi:hypothetical protein